MYLLILLSIHANQVVVHVNLLTNGNDDDDDSKFKINKHDAHSL